MRLLGFIPKSIRTGLKGRIKSSIKYGQRTPFRVGLSILKLHRHRGLSLDPLYFVCSALETFARHTWVEPIARGTLFLPKQLAKWTPFRSFTRAVAYVATPPWRAVTKVFEAIDRQIGLSTQLIPAFIDLFSRSVLEKQKIKAQRGEGRPISEHGQAPVPSASIKVVGRS